MLTLYKGLGNTTPVRIDLMSSLVMYWAAAASTVFSAKLIACVQLQ